MGIKSTQTITRDNAITRIAEISLLQRARDYIGIESTTSEDIHSVVDFIDNEPLFDLDNDTLRKWTNNMIEEQIDKPFYRLSMFDNYFI